MIYLLDASTLITAHNTYYAMHRVPEFWQWLRYHGNEGAIKIPTEIYEEVEDGNDALADWMAEAESRDSLLFAEATQPPLVQQVIGHYGNALTEAEIEVVGRDPFLIAAALADTENRCVVTAEVSKPGRVGANRHIPDVCVACAVSCATPIELLTALNFSTGWAG